VIFNLSKTKRNPYQTTEKKETKRSLKEKKTKTKTKYFCLCKPKQQRSPPPGLVRCQDKHIEATGERERERSCIYIYWTQKRDLGRRGSNGVEKEKGDEERRVD
jgi:hypothetical protein